jgi:hypothetical protein
MENLHAKIDGEEVPVERVDADGRPSGNVDRPGDDDRVPVVPANPIATRKAFFWGAAAAAGAAGLGLLVRTVWNRLGDPEAPARRVKRRRKKKKKKQHHEPT